MSLLFSKDHVLRAIRGWKTEHRQLAPPVGGCPYEAGRPYSVRHRAGADAACVVRVTDVREETLADLTEEAAKAEGFRSRDERLRDWEANYGIVDTTARVHVITFELVDVDDPPRYLARYSPRGYTTRRENALTDPDPDTGQPVAVEAPSRGWMKDRVAEVRKEQSRSEVSRLRDLFADQDTLGDRVRRAISEAKRRQINISADATAIARRCGDIEQKVIAFEEKRAA